MPALLAWAATLSGLPPAPPPPVTRVPQAVLAVQVCGRPCPALGLYADGTIRLAEGLDLATLEARSVLVHELVHHLQQAARGPVADCAEALRREAQAYAVQRAYLAAHGSGATVGLALPTLRCTTQAAGALAAAVLETRLLPPLRAGARPRVAVIVEASLSPARWPGVLRQATCAAVAGADDRAGAWRPRLPAEATLYVRRDYGGGAYGIEPRLRLRIDTDDCTA